MSDDLMREIGGALVRLIRASLTAGSRVLDNIARAILALLLFIGVLWGLGALYHPNRVVEVEPAVHFYHWEREGGRLVLK